MEEKTIRVDGMMCEHCEARVKESLEKIKHVVSASADHEKGEAVLQLDGSVKEKDLKKAIADAGYTYVG